MNGSPHTLRQPVHTAAARTHRGSPHCRVFGILTGTLDEEEGRRNLEKSINEEGFARCSVAASAAVLSVQDEIFLINSSTKKEQAVDLKIRKQRIRHRSIIRTNPRPLKSKILGKISAEN